VERLAAAIEREERARDVVTDALDQALVARDAPLDPRREEPRRRVDVDERDDTGHDDERDERGQDMTHALL